MSDVVVEYKRVGDKTTGRVFYLERDQESVIEAFEQLTFPQMMVRFAEAVSACPDSGAIMQRNDRPGLQPYRLDKDTTQLLRIDPVMVIRSMCLQDNVIVELKKKPSTAVISPLVVGYDSMAATFGDEVFARLRADKLECPCCGVWARIVDGVSSCPSRACNNKLPVTLHGDRWGGVLVTDLLATDCDRFFLPRHWNSCGPWVVRDALATLYKNWLSIKENIK